ncbi:MBL fold metallo-hydrolase [Olsenella sp. Marseille-QA0557]|uniref:MBL fold metallo-hydrolase n=1 Tax=Olsenella sp. Marseille-QA0557 TaxID=3378782 RepID=UPI003D134890
MNISEMLDSIAVPTQSAIRIEGPHDTVVWLDPFHLTDEESRHDATYICITHSHYDHLSPEAIDAVKHQTTRFIVPASVKDEVRSLGVSDITSMCAGDIQHFPDLIVEAVPAYNVLPERLEMHPQAHGWLGYILTFPDNPVRIFCAGDTDQNADNEKISCDIALIPIGGTYTMDPLQAAAFTDTIKPQVVIPIHYGSIVGAYADFDTFAAHVDPHIRVVRKLER